METSDRGGTSSAASVLSELFAGPLGAALAPAAKAARAWYAANGDRERHHTTGVWLRKAGRAGLDPVLVVALDSNLLAGELGTNKDIYLSRLAFRGIAVSDIRFTVRKPSGDAQHGSSIARAGGRGDASVTAPGANSTQRMLPELSQEENERVARATADLPDGLRQSVSRAMCATLRRSKATTT